MDARADAHRAAEGIGKTARHQTRERAFSVACPFADLCALTRRGEGRGPHMGFAAKQEGVQVMPLLQQAQPQFQTAVTGMEFSARGRERRHSFHERSVPKTARGARPGAVPRTGLARWRES